MYKNIFIYAVCGLAYIMFGPLEVWMNECDLSICISRYHEDKKQREEREKKEHEEKEWIRRDRVARRAHLLKLYPRCGGLRLKKQIHECYRARL